MSDVASTESRVWVKPDDVTITKEGKVEITNPRLAEALRTAIKTGGRLRLEDTNTYACNANLYQCGKAQVATGATQVQLR
jgi:hypothetical protein